jgi:mRNA interferase RelE/StbE
VTYRIEYTRSARAHLARMDRRTQERIKDAVDELATEPFGPGTKPLHGVGKLRTARVGGWRIVYTVDSVGTIVVIVAIGPRGQVYRGL